MIRKGFTAASAAWMALAATAGYAQDVTKQAVRPPVAAIPCVTDQEARSLFLVLAAPALRQLSTSCAQYLPVNAFLRTSAAPMLARYDAAGKAAWPGAQAVFVKIGGKQVQPLVEAGLVEPMLQALIGPALAEKIKPTDCALAERLIADLAPLPPENAAGLAVSLIHLGFEAQQKKNPQSKAPFAFCPVSQ